MVGLPKPQMFMDVHGGEGLTLSCQVRSRADTVGYGEMSYGEDESGE